MRPKGEICAVVFDEMTKKNYLTTLKRKTLMGVEDFGSQISSYDVYHATVFMVRGPFER